MRVLGLQFRLGLGPLGSFAALAMLVAADSGGAAEPAPRPNVVFVLVDDLGYGDIGCYGAEGLETPSIDRLASEGLRFTDAYAASPVCSPSRAALLTGRYAVRMGINAVFYPESYEGLDPEELTLAEAMRSAGYRTGLVGKWHLGHHYRHLPLQNGFDEYFGIPYSNDMEMLVYLRGNEVESYEVDQTRLTRRLTEEAIDFLERDSGRPFFLLVAHPMPHVPLHASEAFVGKSERGLYGDVVQEIDWSVGQILDALDRQGLAESTLLIFSSDNGPWLAMDIYGGSSGPLREGKMFTFEGGMRVPLLARWPAGIEARREYRGVTSHLDWMPTLAGLAGAQLPEELELDGFDLRPVLSGEGERASEEFFYFHTSGQLRAYRQGKWKLKRPYNGNRATAWRHAVEAHPLSLFNLLEDPGEERNLAEEHPERAQSMLDRMDAYYESLGELPPSKPVRQPADRSHYQLLGVE